MNQEDEAIDEQEDPQDSQDADLDDNPDPEVTDQEGDAEDSEEGADGDEVEGELVVTIGDDPIPEDDKPAAPWVRELRKTNRDLQKRNRELEEKINAAVAAKPIELGKEPDLEDPDINYDKDIFREKLLDWNAKKQAVEAEAAKAAKAAEDSKKAWETTVATYNENKAKLKVADFDEAEDALRNVLSVTQQGIILDAAKQPEIVVFALGKNEKKAKELAAITNPVKFAAAIGALENTLKVTPRKAPPPEKTIVGSAPKSGSVDSTLERLRKEAKASGDFTKVVAYKRSKK
jgi:hypothetical protein